MCGVEAQGRNGCVAVGQTWVRNPGASTGALGQYHLWGIAQGLQSPPSPEAQPGGHSGAALTVGWGWGGFNGPRRRVMHWTTASNVCFNMSPVLRVSQRTVGPAVALDPIPPK